MLEAPRCPQCQAPLPNEGWAGLCPKCLVRVSLEAGGEDAVRSGELETVKVAPASPTALPLDGTAIPLRRFGDYELLEEIGRGGMGVVYKARQITLNRPVAVKMIASGELARPESVERFHLEAEAAAALQHPNIVAIHEVGVREGQHYYSMDYIEGQTLAERARNNPLAPELATNYLKTIAAAVHYAHQRGILHRDLKPSNVLVDILGQPHLTDFGLAKRLTGDSDLTLTGQVLGSPNYMPPEQALGKRQATTIASDVYSLGGILYFLLTGRPPFEAESVSEILHQVLHSEPVSPRLLNPVVPRDLETICLKCLSKEPERRYGSVHELVEEFGRFLHCEPVQARPLGAPGKVWRWCRRNPKPASLAAVSVVLLLAVVIGSPIAALRINRARGLAQTSATESRSRLVRQYVANGNRLMQEGEAADAVLWFTEALKLEEGSDSEPIHRLRLSLALDHCPRLVNRWALTEEVQTISRDGLRLVLCDNQNGGARIWDVDTGRQTLIGRSDLRPHLSAFSPDGRRLATLGPHKGQGTGVQMWKTAPGEPAALSWERAGNASAFAFSPDGRSLALAIGSTVELRDAQTGEALLTFVAHNDEIRFVTFSPDGNRLLTGSNDTTVRVWDARTGAMLAGPLTHDDSVSRGAFSPDGRFLLTVCDVFHRSPIGAAGEVLVWDSQGGTQPISTLMHKPQIKQLLRLEPTFNDAAFSPDGTSIVTASSDHTAQIWQTTTGEPLTPPLLHKEAVQEAMFSPDGRYVVTVAFARLAPFGSREAEVRVWQRESGQPVTPPLKQRGERLKATFCAGGRYLWTATEQELHLWDLAPTPSMQTRVKGESPLTKLAFHPNGKLLASACRDGTVRVTDCEKWTLALPILTHKGTVYDVAFTPDGGLLATGCGDGSAQVWDTKTAEAVAVPLRLGPAVTHVEFSPDGKQLLTATGLPFINSGRGEASVWNLATFQPTTPPIFRQTADGQVHIVFSPDGRLLLAWLGVARNSAQPHEAQLFDSRTGKPVGPAFAHSAAVSAAAFSHDGRKVITASLDGTAQVWSVAPGPRAAPPFKHAGGVLCAGFSPDDSRAVTGSGDWTARLWDVATGRPLCPALAHDGPVTHAAFSPDGRVLLTLNSGRARLWDTRTGELVSKTSDSWPHLVSAVFAPDGSRLALGDDSGNIRFWNLAPDPRPLNELSTLAEQFCLRQFDGLGGLVPLAVAENDATLDKVWTNARASIQALSPPVARVLPGHLRLSRLGLADPWVLDSGGVLAWHRQQLEDCEQNRQWSGALFHLDRLLTSALDHPGLERRRALVEARTGRWALVAQAHPELGDLVVPRDSYCRAQMIDLSDYYNAFLNERWLSDSPADDRTLTLESLPRGLREFAGIEFDARGVIQLSGGVLRPNVYPARVGGIRINQHCRRLHFLHAGAYGTTAGSQVGSYVVHWANGTQREMPIVYDRHLSDWTSASPAQRTDAELAWSANSKGITLRLYKSTWENPTPDVSVQSLDFVSAMTQVAPFLIAITAE